MSVKIASVLAAAALTTTSPVSAGYVVSTQYAKSDTTCNQIFSVMIRICDAVTPFLLFVMQLMAIDSAIFIRDTLSQQPLLLACGLLILVCTTALIFVCFRALFYAPTGKHKTMDDRCQHGIVLWFLGLIASNSGYGYGQDPLWMSVLLRKLPYISTTQPQEPSVVISIIGVVVAFVFVICTKVDGARLMRVAAALPAMLPIWFFGGITRLVLNLHLIISPNVRIMVSNALLFVGLVYCFCADDGDDDDGAATASNGGHNLLKEK